MSLITHNVSCELRASVPCAVKRQWEWSPSVNALSSSSNNCLPARSTHHIHPQEKNKYTANQILWYLRHPLEGKLHWHNNFLGTQNWRNIQKMIGIKNLTKPRWQVDTQCQKTPHIGSLEFMLLWDLAGRREKGVVNMWPPAINWLAIKEFPWASKHSGARQCEKCVRAHCQEERCWWTTENFYRLQRTPVVPREFCYIPRSPQLILGWCWIRQETQKLICLSRDLA